jgi:hypothetical protein
LMVTYIVLTFHSQPLLGPYFGRPSELALTHMSTSLYDADHMLGGSTKRRAIDSQDFMAVILVGHGEK